MDYDREFQVYTDNHQCEDFEVPYFGSPATLVIAARDLLASKDYDSSHRKYLSQFGSRVLVLPGGRCGRPFVLLGIPMLETRWTRAC